MATERESFEKTESRGRRNIFCLCSSIWGFYLHTETARSCLHSGTSSSLRFLPQPSSRLSLSHRARDRARATVDIVPATKVCLSPNCPTISQGGPQLEVVPKRSTV
ncbi:hypothetical protein L596_000156 [Steinernema carpocapsae]|uniref:Uncharacterized protein n=1 Tax=Steinernema carpocapsae TaxID=34508 RepID=A0A4U8UJQ8_STECR|nr:hypothetical protein L596_000156 [Steinernema carpocapsae]